MSKLLILDLNGVLITKIYNKNTKKNEFTLKEGTIEFLEWAKEQGYTLALFSTSTYNTVKESLDLIFGKTSYPFAFIWNRDHCEFSAKPDANEYIAIKILKRIWKNASVNYKKRYSDKNTLIIDDTLEKMEKNDPKNYLIVNPENNMMDYCNQIVQKFDEM